jgi:hypothetical protein
MLKHGPLEIINKNVFFYVLTFVIILDVTICHSFGYCDFLRFIIIFMLSFYYLIFYTTVSIYVIVLGFIFVIVFVLRHDFFS